MSCDPCSPHAVPLTAAQAAAVALGVWVIRLRCQTTVFSDAVVPSLMEPATVAPVALQPVALKGKNRNIVFQFLNRLILLIIIDYFCVFEGL